MQVCTPEALVDGLFLRLLPHFGEHFRHFRVNRSDGEPGWTLEPRELHSKTLEGIPSVIWTINLGSLEVALASLAEGRDFAFVEA